MTFYKGKAAFGLQDLILRNCIAGTRFGACFYKYLILDCIFTQLVFQAANPGIRFADYGAEIILFDLSFFYFLIQDSKGFGILCGNYDSSCISITPVA